MQERFFKLIKEAPVQLGPPVSCLPTIWQKSKTTVTEQPSSEKGQLCHPLLYLYSLQQAI